ncbi:Hpt domain-containing protein [Bdellovibrio sp. NC01]|uniref:Hpt domain-containing protein n=1 Tax=Bdellovibrio sp. NC01 TaxID=2220073 RepID=UPI00115B1F61|nr:Hpt domain-containing protein [Bdellovibrio sp. NC01]QDK36297.1 hypothetical protein DOE51_01125 [Bdellovibrio sp. NC01]
MAEGFAVPKGSQIKYLQRRLDELQKLEESFKSEVNFELAHKMGHQIKGNASTFNLQSLESFGLRLEKAAQRKDSAAVREELIGLTGIVADLLKELI